MPIKLANNASGTLATAISASDTGLVLTTGNGAEFPTLSAGDYFYATITSSGGTQEIVKATARSGDSLTVVRAQEGTSAAGFAAGARFELRVTAQSVFDAVGDVVASQVGFTPVGGIAATNVQDAIDEVITDLAASSGASMVGYTQGGTNSVARTVQGRLRDVVSAKDFGAVGDGVTDDTAAFNAAVSYVGGLGGGTVFVPGGTYKVSFVNVLHEYVTIEGQGVNASYIVNGSTNQPAIQWGDGVTLIYGGGVKGLRFSSASGVVAASGQSGLQFNKVGQFTVQDVFCQSFPAALYEGIKFTSCSQYTVYAARVQDCTLNGISFVNCVDSYVTDCRSDANSGSGFFLDGSEGSYFKGCTAYFNNAQGWALSSASPGVTAINKNNFFVECIGDTSGSYNWLILDSVNSYFLGCWAATQKDTSVNTFASGFNIETQYSKSLYFTGCAAINNNSNGFNIYDSGSSTPVNIHLVNCEFGSTYNGANGNGKSGSGYGFALNGGVDKIRVIGGSFDGNASGPVLNTSTGTDIVFENSVGYVTSKNGTATVLAGNTTVVVTHGLSVTPQQQDISLTFGSTNGGATDLYVNNITSTQFTINMAPAAGGAVTVNWMARCAGS